MKDKLKKVKKHLKEDIKTFKKEAKEDKKLIKEISKKKSKKKVLTTIEPLPIELEKWLLESWFESVR